MVSFNTKILLWTAAFVGGADKLSDNANKTFASYKIHNIYKEDSRNEILKYADKVKNLYFMDWKDGDYEDREAMKYAMDSLYHDNNNFEFSSEDLKDDYSSFYNEYEKSDKKDNFRKKLLKYIKDNGDVLLRCFDGVNFILGEDDLSEYVIKDNPKKVITRSRYSAFVNKTDIISDDDFIEAYYIYKKDDNTFKPICVKFDYVTNGKPYSIMFNVNDVRIVTRKKA